MAGASSRKAADWAREARLQFICREFKRMNSVLIVEDEKHLADGLRYNLKAEGYDVETAGSGEEALALLVDRGKAFDVLVLDVMLPGIDGFSLASRLRSQGEFMPILMLTARGRSEDVLRGFEAGADDYLPKPFDLTVLLARLNALLRRREWFHQDQTLEQVTKAEAEAPPGDQGDEEFSFNERVIDFANLELRTPEQTIRLTLMEAQLLRYLV